MTPASDDGPGERLSAQIRELIERELGSTVRSISPIEPGLGARRFFRVGLEPASGDGPRSVVARVEHEEDDALRPAGVPPEPPLEPIRALLEREGLPVPRSHGSDGAIALLEDVGDESLESIALHCSDDRLARFYTEACSLIPKLQQIVSTPERVAAFGRRLDAPLFAYKAEQVIEWAVPWSHAGGSSDASLVSPASAAERQVVRSAFAYIAKECARGPARLAHRDFKAANLHVRSADASPLTMIDIQGAFLAPPEYDLVCLLRDSHVALPEELVRELIESTRPRLPDAPDAESFMRRFTLLTLTRTSKDLSRYLYAARIRGDRRYLPLVPRAVDTVKRASLLARDWEPSLRELHEILSAFPEPSCAP